MILKFSILIAVAISTANCHRRQTNKIGWINLGHNERENWPHRSRGFNPQQERRKTLFINHGKRVMDEVCEPVPEDPPIEDDITKLGLWELLEKTEGQLVLDPILTNVHVFLGLTGTGKSVLTQLTAGNSSDLTVYEDNLGRLVVADSSGKIGSSTTSKTLIPDFVYTPELKLDLALYDMPGFLDTRGPKMDITFNYLLKKVMDHVTSTALVFISNFDYFTAPRLERLRDLSRQAVLLINDMDQMDPGIGMIVNMFPHIDANTGRNLTDDAVMNIITTSLNNYKRELEGSMNSVRFRLTRTERDIKQKQIQWVDSLLLPGKISFMRFARKCGPLLDDELMVTTQSNLRNFLKNDLKLVEVDGPRDFDYSLAQDSLLEIDSLVADTNKNISRINTDFVRVQKARQEEASKGFKIFQQVSDFWVKEEYPKISNALKSLKDDQEISKNPEFFARHWQEALGDDGSTREYVRDMSQMGGYMDFFDSMSHKENNREVDRWLADFEKWSNVLEKKRDWYNFLGTKMEEFDGYHFHQIRPDIDVVPDDAGLEFLEETLKMKDIPDRIKEIYNSPDLLSSEDKAALTRMLKVVLVKTKVSCVGNKLTATGGYVMASSFVNENGEWKCEDGNNEITYVVAFASQAFFMNTNVRPDNKVMHEMYIISPRIENPEEVSKVTINLTGKEGEAPYPPQAMSGSKPSEPGKVGPPGTAGVPGNPGDQGGNFFALIGFLKNTASTLAILNGGRGGNGQEGGNGGDASDGADDNEADWPKMNGGYSTCPRNIASQFYRYEKQSDWGPDASNFNIWNRGKKGARGGDAADGGKAGKGGLAGEFKVVQLDKGKQTNIPVQSNLGSDGSAGKGGTRGQGGNEGQGNKGEMRHYTSGAVGVPGSCVYRSVKRWNDERVREPSGNDGVTGGNSAGEKPQPSHKFSQDEAKLIVDYKQFAISNEQPLFPNQFVKMIEESEDVQHIFTPKAFAYELLSLETIALSVAADPKSQSLLIPYYDSFLGRISNYTEDPANSGMSDEDKKVLAILFTSAVAQRRNILPPYGSSIIINVAGYLKSVLDKFEEFKKTKATVIVDDERTKYLEGFEQKISQTMGFIDDTVYPAIEASQNEMDYASGKFVEEVEKVLEAAEVEAETRRKLYEDMKSTMGMRIFMNVLTIGGSALSFLGPTGAAAGGLLGAGANLGGLALGDPSTSRPPINVPEGVKVQAQMLEIQILLGLDRGEDIEQAKETAKFTSKMYSEHEDALGFGVQGSYRKLEDAIEKYEKYGANSNDINLKIQLRVDMQTAAVELDYVLVERKGELQGKIDDPSLSEAEKKEAKEKQKIVDNVKSVTTLINTSVDAARKIMADQSKLETLAALAAEADKAVEDLKTYQQNVNNILLPMIDMIYDGVKAANASDPNRAAIAVRKWQVTKQLNDFKFYLQMFTEGFKSSALMIRCIDRLTEATDMMIDLYDFIAQFQDQMELADYLANINSPNGLAIVIKDKETLGYINKIECSLQASIIISEYEKSSRAFQQWVYPFATLYEGDITLPKDLQQILDPKMDTNSTTYFLIPMLEKNVKFMDQSINDYKNIIIPSIDQSLQRLNFSSSYVSSHPFFVWANEDYGDIIRDFLRGKIVSLFSNPEYSFARKKEAVKFRIAEIVPKCKDPVRNVELQRLLNKYAITMTHSGVSRYISVGKEDINMVGSSIGIDFHYEWDSSGNRVGTNAVYQKIKEGDYILSPYTVWTAQLEIPPTKLAFDDLEPFADCVDLELQGEGTFVKIQ